ncbi:MAG: class I SAM-dependent RNA methyltransferase, partial [Bacteroidota bacterium]
MEILVTTLAGLEEVLAEELRTMGATEVHVRKRAVACVGDQSLLYRANWMLRTAIRVLLPLHQFKARHPDQLYRGIQDIDWSQYLRPSDTLAVDAVARSEVFTHSHFVALKTKDAIVDQLRNRYGRRPSVDTHSPNYRINVHIFDTNVAVSLDSSGHSLHKRGYRVANVMAPLNEVLAAGLVLLSGWQPGQTLIDPFCGSGTILTEAALLAKNRSPQHARREFGFMKWLDYDAGLWRSTRENARKAETPIEGQILGSDIDRGAVSA